MHNQKADAAEYMTIKYRVHSKSEINLDKPENLRLKAIHWFAQTQSTWKESN